MFRVTLNSYKQLKSSVGLLIQNSIHNSMKGKKEK